MVCRYRRPHLPRHERRVGRRPPRHRGPAASGWRTACLHRHEPAEVYRVERGELAIYVDDERIAAAPGDVVHIPGGRAHTVRNESAADAHAYVVFTPGTEIERFMRAAGALAVPSPAEVMSLAERHGIEMLPA